MRGVINKGIQELVESRFGGEKWDEIREEAGCEEPSFCPTVDYPDQSTLGLVAATSKCLGLSADDVMVEFGKYWVVNTGHSTYPSLFALAGNDFYTFLKNLDRLHQQVTLGMRGASPPRLNTERMPDGGLRICYDSARQLCPVLKGLVMGVAEYFNRKVEVRETSCMRDGASVCTFEVRLLEDE